MNAYEQPNGFYGKFLNSESFKNYLKQNKISLNALLDSTNSLNLVVEFLGRWLRFYENPLNYRGEANEVLLDRLKSHGIDTQNQISAMDLLRLVSKKNLSYYAEFNRLDLKKIYSQDIEDTIENLELRLFHNSHYILETPKHPILAPVEFEKIGLLDFGQSTARFNKVLNSHKFVYFKALFSPVDMKAPKVKSYYGSTGVILNKQVAYYEVLISAYIMQPAELYNSLIKTQPSAVKNINSQSSTESYRNGQRELFRYDFTVEDFETLIKAALKNYLSKVTESSKRFQEELLNFKSQDISKLNMFINDLIISNNFLDGYYNYSGFEGVVPLVVQPYDLMYFEAESSPLKNNKN